MKRKEIIMEYHNLKSQLIELKKYYLIQNRDRDIEENFSILLEGKPKVKILKRKKV